MPLGPTAARCAVLTVLALRPLAAQPAPVTPPVERRPPLQEQIDQLREGQDRLLVELREIKTLLQERTARLETPMASRAPDLLTINVFGEPFKGSPAARVAILEYSDFDCSYCAKYATEIYPLIDHAYLKAGTVKYFFRDLPGPEHPGAPFKAKVARCAGDQNRFWEAHDNLFRNQKPFDGPGMAQFTQELGLDGARFQACLTSNRYVEAIQRSADGAQRMRLNGTPAFLIGTLSEDGSLLQATKVFLGAESFQAFRDALDGLLKPSVPGPAKTN
jgi:protein-disulfide isomerase